MPKIVQKLPKIAKNCPKLLKIDKNCPKLKGYLSNYIFHTVLPLEIAPVFAAAKTEDGARIFSSELLLTAPFIFLFFAFHA